MVRILFEGSKRNVSNNLKNFFAFSIKLLKNQRTVTATYEFIYKELN